MTSQMVGKGYVYFRSKFQQGPGDPVNLHGLNVDPEKNWLLKYPVSKQRFMDEHSSRQKVVPSFSSRSFD